jgi:hypothetical protein
MQSGATVSLTPIADLNTYAKNPFGGSNALIEMFCGGNDVAIGDVSVSSKMEYFKTGSLFTDSEEVTQE